MGIKANPEKHYCKEAESGEPAFVLRANDPLAPALVREWADRKRRNLRPDAEEIVDAQKLAFAMEEWKNKKPTTEELKTPGFFAAIEIEKEDVQSLPSQDISQGPIGGAREKEDSPDIGDVVNVKATVLNIVDVTDGRGVAIGKGSLVHIRWPGTGMSVRAVVPYESMIPYKYDRPRNKEEFRRLPKKVQDAFLDDCFPMFWDPGEDKYQEKGDNPYEGHADQMGPAEGGWKGDYDGDAQPGVQEEGEAGHGPRCPPSGAR